MQATGTASWKPAPALITWIWSWWMERRCVPIILRPRSKKDPRRCLGRSRGGLGTKIHALTNQDGLPIRYELTPGEAHDAPPCETLLNNLQPDQHVLADKAYDADWIRGLIWEQGAIDVIPPKSNCKLPAEFDAEIYRERNKTERFFGRSSNPRSAASQPDMRRHHETSCR
ncbi:putative insertion element IS3 family (plasmid) [Roseobacter litoralis Och 149]|uniref:Insertion element IS3 family n=1 Tax=Roseobacter litoralis (strain ATCC 49566 / DSM 6996 / JCM 21268 / NBRC 15278 / OCh 149) TaxID=391595 RepID=F7ZMJ4_ROSLO|nr:putative insertion element IS3 family [Roseobacter litoralis Och 149]